jgi:hypothetical protein
MDNISGNQDDVSQYPDPEQSGLSFPWLDQYQPVPAEMLSASPWPLIHEGFIQQQNQHTAAAGYGLKNHRRSSISLAEEGLPEPSAVLEDSDNDHEFFESDAEAE